MIRTEGWAREERDAEKGHYPVPTSLETSQSELRVQTHGVNREQCPRAHKGEGEYSDLWGWLY